MESMTHLEASSVPLNEEVLFKKMKDAFDQAMDSYSGDICRTYYRFAGKLVHLRVVGRRLMQYTSRSFAHLQTSELIASEPQLIIDLWDENLTGITCPDKAMSEELGETWIIGLRRTVALTRSSDGRFIRYQHQGCTTWLDRNAKHIVGCRAWNDRICMDEYADPISLVLYAWYCDQGVQIIHAGLISENGRGVLFAGPRWSGKSTSALSCLCAGFDYLGDDRIGLQKVEDGSFVGHSIYSSTQMEPDTITRFPSLTPYVTPGNLDGERAVIQLTKIFPERIKSSVQIRAVALPRIVDTHKPRIRPASGGEALLALAPSAKLMPFGPAADNFHNLAQLAQGVPTYWLDLNRNLDEIPSLVRQIIAEARD